MASKILRVSLGGSMPSGEKWTINPCWSIGGDFGIDVTPEQAQAAATAIIAVNPPSGITNAWTAATTLSQVHVEARTLAGVLEAQADATKTTPTPGTGTSALPFQSAYVVSLRTPGVGGRARGRLYFPATGVTLSSTTLRPSSPTPSSFLAAVNQYLGFIEAAIEPILSGTALCVWSRLSQNLNLVNKLQVGDILDVQRRRRDSLIENYVTATYSA
jgi:hypothetical protein